MDKGRLETFSDEIIAIIITIMVLLIEPPKGNDFNFLKELFHLISVYFVSFVMASTYWVNHHHLLKITNSINEKIMWANLLYMFTISFFSCNDGLGRSDKFCKIPDNNLCFYEPYKCNSIYYFGTHNYYFSRL